MRRLFSIILSIRSWRSLQAEGLGDVIVSTQQQRLFAVLLLCLCREQDDRQVAVVRVFFELLDQFIAIHLWHHHIRNDEVQVVCLNDIKCLYAIGGSQDMVVLLQ